jgi:hypothetical protein
VKQGAQKIIQAKQLAPDLPQIDMAVVQNLTMGVMMVGGCRKRGATNR